MNIFILEIILDVKKNARLHDSELFFDNSQIVQYFTSDNEIYLATKHLTNQTAINSGLQNDMTNMKLRQTASIKFVPI